MTLRSTLQSCAHNNLRLLILVYQDWICVFMEPPTAISTHRDCCAFAIVFGKLPKNTISRNYKITNKRLPSCAKGILQNVSS